MSMVVEEKSNLPKGKREQDRIEELHKKVSCGKEQGNAQREEECYLDVL